MLLIIRNPKFRLLWFSTIFNDMGLIMYMVVHGWLALEVTDSPFWVGATAVLAMGIIVLLIIIIALLLRRAPDHFERKHKQVLAKEETALRKASEHLLTNKKKIEQELQKVEDKLKKFSREDDS